jgi:1-acyl-sn-glycerol-3-phosphate acyltransferase
LVQSLLIQPLLRFFVPTSVTGSEHLPTTGPAIVVANHTSHLDVPVLHGVLGRRARSRVVVAAAKDYFFASRAAGALVRQVFGAFPFERDGDSSASLMACRAALTEGRILVLFPEGTRSPSGELGRVRSGAARLAESTGTPIIPVRVDGLATVMPKGTRLPLPGAVHASIGPPIIPTGDVESTRRLVERALARAAIESDRRAA